jgi:hypothetical protein
MTPGTAVTLCNMKMEFKYYYGRQAFFSWYEKEFLYCINIEDLEKRMRTLSVEEVVNHG